MNSYNTKTNKDKLNTVFYREIVKDVIKMELKPLRHVIEQIEQHALH